jgi:hypothetical protein
MQPYVYPVAVFVASLPISLSTSCYRHCKLILSRCCFFSSLSISLPIFLVPSIFQWDDHSIFPHLTQPFLQKELVRREGQRSPHAERQLLARPGKGSLAENIDGELLHLSDPLLSFNLSAAMDQADLAHATKRGRFDAAFAPPCDLLWRTRTPL